MQYHWVSALSFLIVVFLADFASALEPWDDMQVKHTWHAVPVNWESLGHSSAGTTIKLYIALKPEHERSLIDALAEVSTPMHPRHIFLTLFSSRLCSRVLLLRFRYGSYLSKEQVAELVRPYPDTLELITAWLVHYGIRSSSISTTHGGAWLMVTDVLVSQANQLLGASYQLYRNVETNRTIIRTVSYALPSVLHTHIRTVAPTTHFASTWVTPRTPRRRSFGAAPTQGQATSGELVTALSSRDDDEEVHPEFLRWLYKTEGYVLSATDQNRLEVVGFEGQFPSSEDFHTFMDFFFEDQTFAFEQVNGGQFDPNDPRADGQVNLETQYTAAMSHPTPLFFYSTGGDVEWAPNGWPLPGDMYLEWLDRIFDVPNPPQTISFSYGESELGLPADYAYALCQLFAQLGSLGVSVLVASGSEGVGVGDCINGEGNVRFIPVFPSTCTC